MPDMKEEFERYWKRQRAHPSWRRSFLRAFETGYACGLAAQQLAEADRAAAMKAKLSDYETAIVLLNTFVDDKGLMDEYEEWAEKRHASSAASGPAA